MYTLTGSWNIDHAVAREALLATSHHRGADVVALSSAIGDFVGLRGRAYAAYRSGLGPDGTRLPEDFGMVVNAVVVFADAFNAAPTPDPCAPPQGAPRPWPVPAHRRPAPPSAPPRPWRPCPPKFRSPPLPV